jgi:histone H3/H4
MAIQKLIKELAKKRKKKISKKAIKKINDILENELETIILKSSRNADFSGRRIINELDIVT